MAAPNPIFNGSTLTAVTGTSYTTPSIISTSFPEAEVKPAEPMDAQAMTPTDFVLWLNGAIDVLNDTPPTQAQWDAMRQKISGQVGAIVAHRIRAAAQPNVSYSGETSYSTATAASVLAKQQAYTQAYAQKMETYKRQIEDEKAKVYEALAASSAATASFGTAIGKK